MTDRGRRRSRRRMGYNRWGLRGNMGRRMVGEGGTNWWWMRTQRWWL